MVQPMNPSNERSQTRILGVMMSLAGILMVILPFLTWPNSVLFAVLFSPGIPMGLYLAWGGMRMAWNPDE